MFGERPSAYRTRRAWRRHDLTPMGPTTAEHCLSEEVPYFEAHYTPAALDKVTAATLKLSPFMRSRKVLTAATLNDAVRGCDTYATSKVIRGPMSLG